MEVNETTASPQAAANGGRGRRLLAALFPELCVPHAARGPAILQDSLALGVAILLSRTHLAFGMYPFALAYLAAARRRCVPILLGALLGGLRGGAAAGVFALAALLLFGLRALLGQHGVTRGRHATFAEPIALRVTAAAVTGAALAGYELAISGAAPHALRFAAAAILAPTVLAAVLAPIADAPLTVADILGSRAPARHPYGVHRPAVAECSALALLTVLGFALTPLSLFGLSLGGMFAVGVTLLVGRRLSAARAAVTGLCLGLLSSLTDGIALALGGLLAGFLFPYGALYGALGGTVAAVAAGSYLGGLSGFLGIAPEAATAALLSYPVLTRTATYTDPAEAELARRSTQSATVKAAAAQAAGQDRLGRLGTAFTTLSEMFYRLSDEGRRPAVGEYLGECERVCARYCSTCSNRVRCWEQGDRVAERAVFQLATRLREVGRVSTEDIPAELTGSCPQIETILDGIRDGCASMALRRYRGDRNEFLSHDYAMLARILQDAAESDRRAGEENTVVAAAWRGKAGTAADGLSLAVLGTRERRLAAGGTPERLKAVKGELHAAAEAAVGCRLTPPEEGAEGGTAVLTMQTAPRYKVSTATAGAAREGEARSGDCVAFFTSPDGHFYALLSDGEGSGPAAAAASGTACEFLSAMLSAGISQKAALGMLGDLIRTGGEECSATVDMLTLDLVMGGASFVKSGAAPSYIKRGGELLRVRSHTVPLGITRKVDAERVGVELAVGDVVILLSDGLAPDGEDPAWLLSLLAAEPTDDLTRTAERIIAEAVSRTPPPSDDVTVALIRIEEEPQAQ